MDTSRVSWAKIMAALTMVGVAGCAKSAAPAAAEKDPAAAAPAASTAAPTAAASGATPIQAPSPDPAGAADPKTSEPSKNSGAPPAPTAPPPPKPVVGTEVDAGGLRMDKKPNPGGAMSCGAGTCGADMDKKKK
jgi:hypothetical protein